MKVYELRFHDYEFYHTVAVFESREDAEKVMVTGISALDIPSYNFSYETVEEDWVKKRFSIKEVTILPPGSGDWTAKDIVDSLESDGWEMADWFILPLEDDE